MIGTIDIRVQAAKPNFPLDKIRSFVNSPSSLRLRNVPREIGKWEITEVFVSANYPDNSTVSVKAVETAGIYVATIPASTVAGESVNGYTVTANGIDENGAEVDGYILGKGDLEILDADGTITVGETTYYLHLVDSKPATPHKGDVVKSDDGWEIFDGSAWIALPADYDDVRANAATGAAHATTTNKNPHGTTFESLPDKPTIPAEVTESTVRGWGFFKGTIETIKTALSTVFAALKHSHESTEIKVKYGEIEFPLVADPSALNPVTGQAADAYETGKALDAKADVADWYYEENDEGKFLLGVIGDFSDKIAIGYKDGIKSTVTFHGDDSCFVGDLIPASMFFVDSDGKIHHNYYDEVRLGVGALAAVLTDSAKAALFADTAFKTGVATALDEKVAKDKITTLAEAAVEDKITTEDASLVALIKKYGGTKIKEDEKGFYYEVEEEA